MLLVGGVHRLRWGLVLRPKAKLPGNFRIAQASFSRADVLDCDVAVLVASGSEFRRSWRATLTGL